MAWMDQMLTPSPSKSKEPCFPIEHSREEEKYIHHIFRKKNFWIEYNSYILYFLGNITAIVSIIFSNPMLKQRYQVLKLNCTIWLLQCLSKMISIYFYLILVFQDEALGAA